jgi:Protein of unknown function (DUF4197)
MDFEGGSTMGHLNITRRAAMRGALAFAAIGGIAGRGMASILDGLGITKLLGNASDSALTKLSAPDGFYRDTAIRILLPGAKGKFARKLMASGDKLGLTTKLTKRLNDAASLAANEAKPIFRSAISVPGIAASKDGGTRYLQKSAGDDLRGEVRPLIAGALTKVGAFDQLSKDNKMGALLGTIGISNEELTDSVADQAMKGIFKYMGSEEANLRANPGKILGKVL